jgi:hypothetical protein
MLSFRLFVRSSSTAKGAFNSNRQGSLPLAGTLLSAIRSVLHNSSVVHDAVPAAQAPPPPPSLPQRGTLAQRAAEAAAVCSVNDWERADSLVQQFGARADVPLVAEWLRSNRVDVALAFVTARRTCSPGARERVLHALIAAGSFDAAIPLALDTQFVGTWTRATLNLLIARVCDVQLSELALVPFLVQGGAKRRQQLFQSLVDLFRASRCAVNAATTNAVLTAWLAMRAERAAIDVADRIAPSLRQQWEAVETLLKKMDTTRALADAPINGCTLIELTKLVESADDAAFALDLRERSKLPMNGSLCVELVRAFVRIGDLQRADTLLHGAAMELSSEQWAEVIAAFDRAGHANEAARYLFQQEQSWSLPTTSACKRMLLTLSNVSRDEATQRKKAESSATPMSVHSLFRRADHHVTPAYLSALALANAAFGHVQQVGHQFTQAQAAGIRLQRRVFMRAIEANFRHGNLGNALLAWRMYTVAYPDLYGDCLERSVHAFARSQHVLNQLGMHVDRYFSAVAVDEHPIVDWRWRRGDDEDEQVLARFVQTASASTLRPEAAVRKFADKYLVTTAPRTDHLDLAGAYRRFHALHYQSQNLG